MKYANLSIINLWINYLNPIIAYICNAIAINKDDGFDDSLIPHFINGDIEWQDPSFTSFKRIYLIDLRYSSDETIVKNLRLIESASVIIDNFIISDNILKILEEYYKERKCKLIIDELTLDKSITNVSSKLIKIINQIKLNSLIIEEVKQSFDDLKLLLPVNLQSLNVEFEDKDERGKMLMLKFLNYPTLIWTTSIIQLNFILDMNVNI